MENQSIRDKKPLVVVVLDSTFVQMVVDPFRAYKMVPQHANKKLLKKIIGKNSLEYFEIKTHSWFMHIPVFIESCHIFDFPIRNSQKLNIDNNGTDYQRD